MRQLKITTSITDRNSASIERYFREISKEELITTEQEVDLVKRIKAGDQIALHKLVKANLRFVVSVAKRYKHSKIALDDLINEGNLGLIKAAHRFDETRGFKFISYAVWWIRQAIVEALSKHARTIRMPLNRISDMSKLDQASSSLEQQLERMPTDQELAELLKLDVEDIRKTVRSIAKEVSLDKPFAEDEQRSLINILPNEEYNFVENELIEKSSMQDDINRFLSHLTKKEQGIVKKLFGIGTDSPMTLEDIANEYNMSRERIRQIKQNAIKKIRGMHGVQQLASYLA